MKTEKSQIDLTLNENPLINIGIKVLIFVTFVILLHGVSPLFPLPFSNLFKLKWMFHDWEFVGTQSFLNYTEVRFQRGVLPLLIVLSLIFLLKKSKVDGFKSYFLNLVIFAQIFMLAFDILSIIFNYSEHFFDPIWKRVFKFWGFTTLILFIPYILGNNLSKGLPEQYLNFVSKFFSSDTLRGNILKIFVAFTAISYLYEIL